MVVHGIPGWPIACFHMAGDEIAYGVCAWEACERVASMRSCVFVLNGKEDLKLYLLTLHLFSLLFPCR